MKKNESDKTSVTRKDFLKKTAIIAGAATVGGIGLKIASYKLSPSIVNSKKWDISKQAEELHKKSIVVDTTLPLMPTASISSFLLYMKKMHQSGITFVSLTVGSDFHTTSEVKNNITKLKTLLLLKSYEIVFVETVDDIKRAKKENKLAVGIHFQGTGPIEDDLSNIEYFYERGVRHMLMAYNEKNLVGYGCFEKIDKGLTEFGKTVVKEMNRVGMIVDVAHTGYRTSLDAIEASTAPVIVSHGNVASIYKHQRAYKDDQIKAIAAKRGVFGVTGVGWFLGSSKSLLEQYVRNIDHIVQLVGPEYAGIGLDNVYDYNAFNQLTIKFPEKYPKEGGYKNPLVQVELSEIPRLTETLLKRGYSEDHISKILGENWLRVFSEVWI